LGFKIKQNSHQNISFNELMWTIFSQLYMHAVIHIRLKSNWCLFFQSKQMYWI